MFFSKYIHDHHPSTKSSNDSLTAAFNLQEMESFLICISFSGYHIKNIWSFSTDDIYVIRAKHVLDFYTVELRPTFEPYNEYCERQWWRLIKKTSTLSLWHQRSTYSKTTTAFLSPEKNKSLAAHDEMTFPVLTLHITKSVFCFSSYWSMCNFRAGPRPNSHDSCWSLLASSLFLLVLAPVSTAWTHILESATNTSVLILPPCQLWAGFKTHFISSDTILAHFQLLGYNFHRSKRYSLGCLFSCHMHFYCSRFISTGHKSWGGFGFMRAELRLWLLF